jgi:hypothetical protein
MSERCVTTVLLNDGVPLWMWTGQTKDDETHVIWPVAGRLAALSDHAELPVMMPREFDEDMRRDG